MPFAVYTTLDSEDDARVLAREAVDQGFAACVHIQPIDSVYRWNGIIDEAREIRLMFKVGKAGYDRLAAYILAAHPYDEPALWAVEMVRGSESFFDWIDAETALKD